MNTGTASTSDSSHTSAQTMRVLCGVDGSGTDPETVRQAAILAGAGGALQLVCVSSRFGVGASAQATITRGRADLALMSAQAVAAELDVEASTRVVEDSDDWEGIARVAGGNDVLVLGSHSRSRAEGIMVGRITTRALHESELPVLIARPTEGVFPRRILLASDGSPDSRSAAALAAQVAGAHGSEVTLMNVGTPEDSAHRHVLAEESAQVFRACGVEPALLQRTGSVHECILRAADELGVSLLVVGSGGKRGPRAIGSVSERVAHHAPCSVLVVRESA